MSTPVVLVTGAARRVGTTITRHLHTAGYDIAVHYYRSASEAEALCAELSAIRPNSARAFAADLDDPSAPAALVNEVLDVFGRLDGLVNNASSFFPTPMAEATVAQWDALMAVNARAPFFLAQAAAASLRCQAGAIVNIVDIYAERPLPRYPAYSASKAALRMVTAALADALAPEVRVNAVAPGTVLWSDNVIKAESVEQVVSGTRLGRVGRPEDVAAAVLFLLRDAHYTTGVVLPVDGGRLLHT
ncbi:pteridine reductase [Silanimonas sp.]|uniref:pteridine reductase n=1 Tax=Silanimonas sp. TaxID=1929290 RepID=UPI001BBC2B97|nr:pteridine reductase [Silanimonas sp.]MBS3896357.1 pteridine reductase [Silanimonas sp.]